MTEETKKFVIKKGIKTGNVETDQYIEELHQYLENFEASNIKKLILTIDRLAGVIAEDINKIIEGDVESEYEVMTGEFDDDGDPEYETKHVSNLKILSDYKDSKVYDRLMALITRVPQFEIVSKTAKGLIPDVVEYVERTEVQKQVEDIKLSGVGNTFEEMQGRHMGKRTGKNIV